MSGNAGIVSHYDSSNLSGRLAEVLEAAGLAGMRLSPKDLAPLDQFHVRGLAATVELATAIGIEAGTSIIDVGSGLGGPSRYLAATFDCHVFGIDLSPAFVEAATYLAMRTGLGDKVAYDCADALSLPCESGRFDLAWTQHVAMNIADRARLYAEVYRVLRPGGRFAIYDVVEGAGGPIHFPVPWSRTAETSFLVTPSAMRETLEQQGFTVSLWADKTDAGIAWYEEQRKAAGPRGPLGLHVAMGPDFPVMAANLGRNLREGRVGLVQALLRRP